MNKRITKYLLLLGIIPTILFFISQFVLADTWDYYVEFTVAENSSTDRTYLPILTGINGQNLIDSGYLSSSGNITNMMEGSSNTDYGAATSNITLLIPSLLASQERTYRFYTNYVPSVAHKIILGLAGYFTISDDSALEIGDNGTVRLTNTYIDFGSSDNIVSKENSFAIYNTSSNISAVVYGADSATNLTLEADAAGDETNLTVSGSPTNWQAVSTNNDTTYVYTAGAVYVRDLYSLTDSTVSGPINSVTFYFRIRQTAGGADTYAKPHFKIGGTVYDGNEQTQAGTSWATKNQAFSTSPATSSNWTWSEINDMQIGISLKNGAGGAQAQASRAYVTVNYNPLIRAASVNATGLSSGNYTIEASLNTTNLTISIDGIVEDTDALSGVSIPNYATDWVIGGNSTRCISDFQIDVDGTTKASYAPTSIINGTTLKDQTGSYNATITWGTNPSNVIITISGITSEQDATASGSGTASTISHKFQEASEPGNWFVSGTFGGTLTPELKETFANTASNIGMPEQSLWLIIWFGVSTAIGLSVLIFTGNILLTSIIIIACLWSGVNANIIDFGLVFIVIVLTFGGVYLARQR